jgi:hypothetical protein
MGLSINEYNEMTPYELGLHVEVFTDKLHFEQDEKKTIAWMTAYLHRVDKMPSLQELLNKKEKKEMTEDEMLEAVKQLNIAFGGKVQTKEGE